MQMMCSPKGEVVMLASICYAAFVGYCLVLGNCGRVPFCGACALHRWCFCAVVLVLVPRGVIHLLSMMYIMLYDTGLILHISKEHSFLLYQYNE